jgi:1,3-beta-glucanosyltransferase GAS1
MRLSSLILGATAVNALPTITVAGNKFFDSNGKQFFMKGMRLTWRLPNTLIHPGLTRIAGVAYQLTEEDPLVDTAQCARDASLMKTLGVNSIRVYHVDAKADHDGCMAEFARAGIYPIIDLDTFDTYILPVGRLLASCCSG